MINKYYLNNIKKLNQEFNKNKPFQHLVLKDFFNKKEIEIIAKELRKESFSHYESDLFSFSQTNDLVNTKNKKLKEFYNFLNSKEFKEYLFKITGIKATGKIDCSGFIYQSTDYLLPHDDRLETRKIAYILNLTNNFTKKDGGNLEFFGKNKVVKTILPEFNAFTIFKVEVNKTFHKVSEIFGNKERLSIAGWYNDK